LRTLVAQPFPPIIKDDLNLHPQLLHPLLSLHLFLSFQAVFTTVNGRDVAQSLALPGAGANLRSLLGPDG